MAIDSLIIGTDNVLQLDALTDQSDSTFLNAATVTVTLLTRDGTEVSGETWPLTMDYVTSSDGRYTATLSDVLVLELNKRYQAVIVADGGAGKKRTWYHGLNAIRG